MDNSPDKKRMFEVPKPPAELSSWIHSIYVVTFDIEFGQAIETQYPKSTELEISESESNNICYSSFPDSNSSILGSTQFHFKMRLSKLDDRLKRFYSYYNTQTTQALSVDPKFIFGYVHFLQKKDSTLKRGYFQKSLVILSLLPFVELFYNVVTIVGTNYFDNEQLLNLENVYNQTRRWPLLQTGNVLNLTIMGSTMAFYVPNKDDKLNNLHANLSPTSSSLANKMKLLRNKLPGHEQDHQNHHNFHLNQGEDNHYGNNNRNMAPMTSYLATSIHGTPLTLVNHHQHYHTILTAFDLDLYKCFYSVISDLQLLWEMVLTCEPFIVIAHTPDVCANFVQALIGLIYPFKYCADYRPFFTIHDPEFREYIGLKDAKPNVILGVTNPFFAKSLEHWPNVVQLCGMTSSKSSDQLSSLISSFSSLASQSQQNHQQSKVSFVDKLRFTNIEANKPGLDTKLKPFLQKDRNFLTKILRRNKTHGDARPNNVQTALIRRWLIELTQSFFMPLERYLTQLMPLHSKISPFKMPPELPTFDFEAFLTTIDTSGPQLTTKVKGDWLGLYRKFFNCPNFNIWYSERKSEIDRKLWSLYLESFLEIDLPQVIKNKKEVEVVDMVIFLQRRLDEAVKKSHEFQFTCDNLDQFRFKSVQLINTLPDDLRAFFLERQ